MFAIVTSATTFLFPSYIIPIGCVLLKRIRGEPLPPRRWSLGRFGMLINILSLLYLLPIFVFTFFPLAIPVVNETMNWTIVVYGVMITIVIVFYLLYGRFNYGPPVAFVKREM